ncbi:MAG: acetate--CoA ligase family protein, partial [Burkholderiales bacterium]|nr:acetate--CoA ligase family protein [Burkholderiales bacterium]
GRDLLMAAINDEHYDLPKKIAKLTDLVDARCLGPSTSSIVDAATERRIPFIRLTDGNLVQLGHGAAQHRIWTAETDNTSAIAESIACDKDLTKTLLKSCGVPVPEGRIVRSADEAWEEAQDIGLPVVLKPYDGNHGRGVSLNLMTQSDVEAAYELAARKGGSKSVIVERFIVGNEHRVLVVGKSVVAVAKGESLWVHGDGQSTIKQLVETQINIDPRRGTTEEYPLNIVDTDVSAEVILELQRQGMRADSIPLAGQKVLIQPNGNVALDITDDIHPEVAAAATLAARVVGLDIAGVDLVAEDISRPLESQGGAIIEVNASPGLLAHIKPSNGDGRPVGKAIIDHLFAVEETGRIDIVGVAGTRGTSLISRLIGALVHINGHQTGVACKQGLFINNQVVTNGDNANWEAGQRLLINRSVQAAIFETHSKEILSNGLAYDKCTVGVVTDMDGHQELGEFYIDDAEQMRKILRTQIDVVLPSGVAVLNADEPAVAELAELCDGKVIFYGLNSQSEEMTSHRAKGERVVFIHDGNVVLAAGNEETALLPLSMLKPAKAKQPEVVMAAV